MTPDEQKAGIDRVRHLLTEFFGKCAAQSPPLEARDCLYLVTFAGWLQFVPVLLPWNSALTTDSLKRVFGYTVVNVTGEFIWQVHRCGNLGPHGPDLPGRTAQDLGPAAFKWATQILGTPGSPPEDPRRADVAWKLLREFNNLNVAPLFAKTLIPLLPPAGEGKPPAAWQKIARAVRGRVANEASFYDHVKQEAGMDEAEELCSPEEFQRKLPGVLMQYLLNPIAGEEAHMMLDRNGKITWNYGKAIDREVQAMATAKTHDENRESLEGEVPDGPGEGRLPRIETIRSPEAPPVRQVAAVELVRQVRDALSRRRAKENQGSGIDLGCQFLLAELDAGGTLSQAEFADQVGATRPTLSEGVKAARDMLRAQGLDLPER